jgi:hypothetical protein
MGGKLPVILGRDQVSGAATDWHDGQISFCAPQVR